MYICRFVDMYMCTSNSLHLPHTEFISRVSVPAVERFVEDFEAIIRRLSENPYQFPSCNDPNLADTYRKTVFAKWYKMIFSVEDDTVCIDAVVDGRQSPK